MSDNDLIRRSDALEVAKSIFRTSGLGLYGAKGAAHISTDPAVAISEAIAAIPAADTPSYWNDGKLGRLVYWLRRAEDYPDVIYTEEECYHLFADAARAITALRARPATGGDA